VAHARIIHRRQARKEGSGRFLLKEETGSVGNRRESASITGGNENLVRIRWKRERLNVSRFASGG
jgi:hypothetical protein